MSNNCIHHLFEAQVARTPGADAILFEDRSMSYAELNRRSNQVAHYLRGLGVGPEVLVGLSMRRTPELLVALFGILKAGGAYVAIDPAYPKARQAFIIEDAAMPVLLTEEALRDNVPETAARVICLDTDGEAIGRESGENPAVEMDQRNLIYVLFTSGSTGKPKGAALQHSSVVALVEWSLGEYTPADLAGTLFSTSINFDLSVYEMFVPLACGGTLILAENALALPGLPARDRVTLINTVPSAMSALVRIDGVPEGVRIVNLCGEPLPNKLAQDIYHSTGKVEKVYNLYGPVEDTVYSTFAVVVKGATTKPTIGIPLTGTEVHLVDDQLRPVAPGENGELCLSGRGLARGYLNRPDITAERFVRNPFGEGRMYRTGDLARMLPDGNLDFLGRMDYQVKVRGYRIELGEVETVMEQHPAIDRAVVLAQPDPRGDLQLVSYFSPSAQAADSVADSEDAEAHVKMWAKVYDDAYSGEAQADLAPPEDRSFDIRCWISSYTGHPIPAPEMREWLDATVDILLDLKPRNVLELGCGTGLIVARVAPHCDRYVGLDIAPTAIENIRAMQASNPDLERVTLFERPADDLSGLEPIFDLVVINSVVQHFPDAAYLERVLDGAAKLVRPGGHIFVGDVLSLPLQEAYHTSVQVFRAADTDPCAEVKRRIRKQIAQERDLLFAPEFFAAFGAKREAISHVQILPKRGRFVNQLTRFRFDAVLHVGGAAVPAARDGNWLDWRQEKLSVEALKARLAANPAAVVAVRNIPNARLHEEDTAAQWLRDSLPDQTIAELRAHLKTSAVRGIDPEDLLDIPGYRTELSWFPASGAVDAVFTPIGMAGAPAVFRQTAELAKRPLQDFANRPHQAKLSRDLVPQVRQYLEERLPHYMVPSLFTVLDKFPLTPNGKIDRKALTQLQGAGEAAREEAVEPSTPLERMLLEAWTETLGISHAGVHDNFFALGGNSLSAVALTHQLQKLFQRTFRPAVLMQAPSVAEFAAYLSKTNPGMELSETAGTAAAVMEEGEI